jgi:D-hydroxyproline dehydrogenase subunit gamma
MAKRLTAYIERGQSLTLCINGDTVSAYDGETIATVLFAENINIFYRTRDNQPRAPYCNMGTCFECQVKVKKDSNADSSTWVRACMTLAEEGMIITTGDKVHDES